MPGHGQVDDSQVEAIRETDGLVVGMYKHLWMKNQDGKPCDVNIPHTVIYRDSQPFAWYFTSEKEQRVMRKKRENMVGPQIAEAFEKNMDPTTPVGAWFNGKMTLISMGGPRRKAATWVDPDYKETMDCRTEHLACERVHNFLDPGQYRMVTEELFDGVLQRFVEPREVYDHLIRGIWTPNAVIFEKRTNKVPITSDAEPVLQNRAASFSAAGQFLCHHSPLPTPLTGGALCKQLEVQCEGIAGHLREVTQGAVTPARMELFFKVDRNNKIWFLYCGALTLDHSAAILARRGSLAPAERKGALRDPTAGPKVKELEVDEHDFLCALTGETHPGARKIQVTYKLLIQHWLMEAAQMVCEADRINAIDTLPPALRRANPNMTREYYLKHRASPNFLLNTANVCPEAAALLTKAALEDIGAVLSRPLATLVSSMDATNSGRATDQMRKSTRRPVGAVLLRPLSSPGSTRRPPPQPRVVVTTHMVQSHYGGHKTLPTALQPKPEEEEDDDAAAGQDATSSAQPESPAGLEGGPAGDVSPAPSPAASPAVRSPGPASSSPKKATAKPSTQPRRTTSPSRASPARASPARIRPTIKTTGLTPARGDAAGAVSPTRGAVVYGGGQSPSRGVPTAYGLYPGQDVPISSTARRLQILENYAAPNVVAAAIAGDPPPPSPGFRGSAPAPTKYLSPEDLKTLRELSEAYSQAEAVTQQLLAEAQDVLQQQPGSRSGTAGASGSAAAGGGSALPAVPGAATSSSGRPPSGTQRTSGSTVLPQMARVPSGSGSSPAAAAAAASSSGAEPVALPPVGGGSRRPSAGAAAAPAAAEAPAAEGAAAAATLTTDEAALLAEALTGE